MNKMTYKGFHAQVMEAERLTGEHIHGLPPGRPLTIFNSDEFVAWPENWMKGHGVFLVPVKTNKGIWFDWRENCPNNTAIIPTIKGCNPYTGLQTSGFHLERYSEKCPRHGTAFIGDNFCSDCNYKWPPQNYLSPGNIYWLDGWLNPKDGSVRQFFFTEDELRDVATALIGPENAVPAFGFAFYKPKVPRPPMNHSYRSPGMFEVKCSSWSYTNTGSDASTYLYSSAVDSLNALKSIKKMRSASGELSGGYPTPGASQVLYSASAMSDTSGVPIACASGPVDSMDLIGEVDCERGFSAERGEPKVVKEVSVGAGAKIRQELQKDPFSLDSWCDTPEAVMTIYFVFQEKFEELKAGGMRDLEGKPEGMLSGIPVG
jgi:hypothetical protein